MHAGVRFNFTLAWAIVRRPITGERSERFIDQSQASEASGELRCELFGVSVKNPKKNTKTVFRVL